ncbi:MAG: AtpZ/AtpI family protein [Myxococcales bacterium]|nr:AtpZ/AtpI family protein [Myxococcales bacterium]USN49902.1 MAG: AtpZ/AtpI family protein [Myxococcales bacterium]
MNKLSDKDNKGESEFSKKIQASSKRKLRAKKHSKNVVWFGLGMMGIIGWSIAIPTLIGAFIGIWLDNKYPTKHSWTLTLLVVGLVFGCFNAWHWVKREEKEITKEEKDDED